MQQVTVPLETDFGSDPDVVLLDGSVYFVYQNSTTGEIRIAKATAPA